MTKTGTTSRTRRFYVVRGTATHIGRPNTNSWYVMDRQSGRAVETLHDRMGARLAADYFNTVHADTDPEEL